MNLFPHRFPPLPRRWTRRLLTGVIATGLVALILALAGFWQRSWLPALPSVERPASAAQTGTALTTPAALTVLAAGDLRGEIKPCGCSPEGQQGGLPRRLSYLAKALHGPGPAPILVDLGNNFPEATAQGRYKIDLIRTLLEHDAPQAVLPGPGELALGIDALKGGLPYVVSNDSVGTAFPAVRTVERADRRVGIYGYLSPKAVYQGMHVDFHLEPADAALVAGLRKRIAAQHDDATLLLFRGDDVELATLTRSGLFDLIVAGNPSDDELHQITERNVAGLRIPQVPTKGQGLLRLKLDGPGHPGAKDIAVDWLGDRWPDAPAAAPVFAAYDERVKALFFARLQTQREQEQNSPYAGEEACKTCHPAQAAIWNASQHSHALATLERVGHQYDPECLACHVLALRKGGYLSQDLTPQYANVQCESCHGPSKAHAGNFKLPTGPPPSADGSKLVHPTEQTCRTCHRGSHSPHFSFATYWPKIIHGKGAVLPLPGQAEPPKAASGK